MSGAIGSQTRRVLEMPGWSRLSLTANDDMVERAIPVLVRARVRS